MLEKALEQDHLLIAGGVIVVVIAVLLAIAVAKFLKRFHAESAEMDRRRAQMRAEHDAMRERMRRNRIDMDKRLGR